MESNYSALILKYNTKLKKDPSSSAFAPLAEIYIKMGQFDDALSVLKKGLKHNSKSVYGYICLADCYSQRGEFDLAFATLGPLVANYSENLKLQKIFANAAYQLGRYSEALDAYKRILFFNPCNSDVATQVKKLEDYLSESVIVEKSSESKKEVSSFPQKDFFPADALDHTKIDDDFEGWVHMDLSQKKEDESSEQKEEKEELVGPEASNKDDNSKVVEETVSNKQESTEPQYFQTSSMLDIFIGQKLWSSAKDMVEQLLETAPEKQREALLEKQKMILTELEKQLKSSASSGDDLMDLYDQKVSQVEVEEESIAQNHSRDMELDLQGAAVVKKAKLLKFLELVKDRSHQS